MAQFFKGELFFGLLILAAGTALLIVRLRAKSMTAGSDDDNDDSQNNDSDDSGYGDIHFTDDSESAEDPVLNRVEVVVVPLDDPQTLDDLNEEREFSNTFLSEQTCVVEDLTRVTDITAESTYVRGGNESTERMIRDENFSTDFSEEPDVPVHSRGAASTSSPRDVNVIDDVVDVFLKEAHLCVEDVNQLTCYRAAELLEKHIDVLFSENVLTLR